MNNRVTNCPGMPGTVSESRECVPSPGQKQSGTIKCPGIESTALIMVKVLLYLARVDIMLTFSNPNGRKGTPFVQFRYNQSHGLTAQGNRE